MRTLFMILSSIIVKRLGLPFGSPVRMKNEWMVWSLFGPWRWAVRQP